MSSNLSFNKLKNSKLQAAAFEYLINFDKTKYLLSNSLDDHSFFHTHLIESKKAFEGARPPPIFKQNFKIWNVFTNFFNQAPAEVDESLAAHSFTEHLIENYTEILEPGFLEYLSFEEQCANNLYYLRLCQWMQILKLLTDFRKNFSENHHCEMTHFPAWLQNSLKEMAATKGANRNLKVLFEQSGDALASSINF